MKKTMRQKSVLMRLKASLLMLDVIMDSVSFSPKLYPIVLPMFERARTYIEIEIDRLRK